MLMLKRGQTPTKKHFQNSIRKKLHLAKNINKNTKTPHLIIKNEIK